MSTHLRNVINRANVSAASINDYACDDFFLLIIRCHIVAAAMQYLDMSDISDKPIHPQLEDELWHDSKEKRSDVLLSVAMVYADLEVKPTDCSTSDKVQC